MKTIDQTLCGNIKGDSFGRRMRKAREHLAVSRKEASERIGLSANQLGRIERGGVQMVSDPATIVRAARVYNVSDVWLYSGGVAGARFIPDWYEAPDMEAA